MNKIFKIILSTIFLFCGINKVSASELSNLIKLSPLDKSSTIAVSIKDVETGKTVYEYNEHKLLHPASTLKVFTIFPALDAIGEDYNFQTSFYAANGNLYVKLGADPFLSSQNLNDAAKQISSLGFKNFQNIYFDDSIVDNLEWGIGWMWDDSTNALMPKFGAYNLDNNLATITVSKDVNGSPIINSKEKFPCLNNVTSGSENKIYALRHEWISPDITCIKGSIANAASLQIPINNLQRNFEIHLLSYLKKANINIENKTIQKTEIPNNAKLLYSISHSANYTVDNIFKNSNNMNAEILAKVAGGVKSKSTGTIVQQINVFYDYWKKNNVDTNEVIIADASGVSRNNLITTDFMTNALNSLYCRYGAQKIYSYLAQPGEGTLDNRLLNYRGSVFLKTGTLSNISGLTGYVITDSGKTYSVAILIQNFAYPISQIKVFENKIIDAVKHL